LPFIDQLGHRVFINYRFGVVKPAVFPAEGEIADEAANGFGGPVRQQAVNMGFPVVAIRWKRQVVRS